MSPFNNNQKLRKPYKAEFGQFLKSLVEPVEQKTAATVIDEGWLFFQISWKTGTTYCNIASMFLNSLRRFQKSGKAVIVVFDGYERSPRDHDHSKRTKSLCGNIKIGLDKASNITKKRLLDNLHNKAELTKATPI